MTEFVTLYVTAANREEARAIAHTLLQERLIACANIVEGAMSLYRWNGELQEEHEAVLLAKTSATKAERAMARVKQLHSYYCPCVTAWPIVAIDADYAAWLREQLAD